MYFIDPNRVRRSLCVCGFEELQACWCLWVLESKHWLVELKSSFICIGKNTICLNTITNFKYSTICTYCMQQPLPSDPQSRRGKSWNPPQGDRRSLRGSCRRLVLLSSNQPIDDRCHSHGSTLRCFHLCIGCRCSAGLGSTSGGQIWDPVCHWLQGKKFCDWLLLSQHWTLWESCGYVSDLSIIWQTSWWWDVDLCVC